MLKSCTRNYSDESDENTFRFTFYCDVCGKPFRAAPVSLAGCEPPPVGAYDKCWRLLWMDEHGKAFERADFEASHHFFSCPGCGLYVCEVCTAATTEDDGTVRLLRCVKCEQRVNRAKPSSHLRFVYESHTIPPAEEERR